MDFHGLARRELQALCKKNKIPANITNVAMADALSVLPHVEGIEEMMQLQSPERVGIDSSKTGLTSTRGRKTVTKEPESSQPVSCSRLGSRRRMKVDPEVDESKKEDLRTPAVRKRAPVAASSRRKKVEENSVQKVYSTRRSVRLAEQMAGLSLDEGVEKNEAGKIDCDLSRDNFVNCDKESDIGSEKKAATEEDLTEKVDMQGVAYITTAGDDENETDAKDNVAVVNAEPDVEVKHECKGEECNDEAIVKTNQDVGCKVNQTKVECEVEESNEEAKAETKQDVGCEELLEVNDLIREDTEEAIIVKGESDETKGSDSSPATTVFSDAVISDSNSTHSDALLDTMELESVTDENPSRNQMASLDQQESGEEETVASDHDSSDDTTEGDSSSAEACYKITALEIEADAESSLAINEKAASPIKQQTMASETDNLVSGISETEEKFATEADVESSVIAEESSHLLEEETIVTEQLKMKMELKSNDDKENFAGYEEKKMKTMEVNEQKNMPYGDLSLRQLSKMLKAFHLENNGKKNVAAVKVCKTTRTALQALPENHQMTTEKEN